MDTAIVLSSLALGVFLLWKGWMRAFLVLVALYFVVVPIAVILLWP